MKRILLAFALSGGPSIIAHAQEAPSLAGGVRTSTDPARAAAIQDRAREIKSRAGIQPKVFFRGKTDAGLSILSGGTSAGDLRIMHAERAAYSLWVATIAKPSGAYLADARLRIVDLSDGSVVLERIMEGPWLMAALPVGRYEISATFMADGATQDQALSDRVTIPERGQRQVVLRFDSPAEVSPERSSPFKGNPFGARAVDEPAPVTAPQAGR